MRWWILLLGAGCKSTPTPAPEADADTDADTDTDTDADTDTDSDTDSDSDSDTDVGFSLTVNVDGNLIDFPANTRFPTTGGVTGIAWDATNLYVGVQHPDVAGGGAEHWVMLTIGAGGAGLTDGVALGSQQPALPFTATHALGWKADNSYHALWQASGGSWSATDGWLGTAGGSVVENDAAQAVEFAIPWAGIGDPASVDLHVAWVYEGASSPSTFAPTPASSFVDGFDPDVGAWYHFVRSNLDAPSSYDPEGAPLDTDPPVDTDPPDTGDTDPGPWRAALTVDGSRADWPVGALRSTTSAGEVALTWDDAALYVGVDHPDVGSDDLHWVQIYVGTPGTSDGVLFGTQQPALPFAASGMFGWKADGSYQALWTGGPAWAPDAGWLAGAGGSVAASGDVFEVRLPFASLGAGDELAIAVLQVFEGAGFESTYAGVPADAFTDGYDPDVLRWLTIDRNSPTRPADLTSSP